MTQRINQERNLKLPNKNEPDLNQIKTKTQYFEMCGMQSLEKIESTQHTREQKRGLQNRKNSKLNLMLVEEIKK